jgi:hypothetical protein
MTSLDFDSTAADVLALSEHVAGAELKRNLGVGAGLAAAIGVCASCLAVLLEFGGAWLAVFVALAGLGPVAVVLGGRARFRAIVRRSAAGAGVIGRRRLTLEDDGLRATHAFGESFLRWSAISGTVRTERHLFVMAGAQLGIPIPRAAFGTAGELDAFAAEVERRRAVTAAVA